MKNYICLTCGIQFAASEQPPDQCPICEDDRQYVNAQGQSWTTLAELQTDRHNLIKPLEAGLTGIGTEPRFAIGQRALLVQTPQENILWDCISLVDEATVTAIQALGGVAAMAVSHPHFYSSMVEWSHALGHVPIYLHAANRPWVMRPDPAIVFWEGETYSPLEGITLIHCGGHFEGSTVLHWAAGAEGQGALLTADTIYVASDRRYVSFMHSFPNLIPLPASAVRGIVAAVEPFAFERIYGGWFETVVATDGKAAVKRSAERYIKAIQG